MSSQREVGMWPRWWFPAAFLASFAVLALIFVVAYMLTKSAVVQRPAELCHTASEDSPMVGCHLDYRPTGDGGDWWYVP